MEKEVVTVGLDLAKNVFQVHAIGADGAVLIRRKLRRTEVIRFFAELSIGVQKGPPIGVQKGPRLSSGVTGMAGVPFALVAA